jgi:hypothetical protein
MYEKHSLLSGDSRVSDPIFLPHHLSAFVFHRYTHVHMHIHTLTNIHVHMHCARIRHYTFTHTALFLPYFPTSHVDGSRVFPLLLNTPYLLMPCGAPQPRDQLKAMSPNH